VANMNNNSDDRNFIYSIDSEDKIIFLNKQWDEFAKENEAEKLTRDLLVGVNLWDFITDHVVQHLYKIVFEKVRTGKKIAKLPYRCDAPDCRRYMEMDLLCLDQNEIQIVNRILKMEFRDTVHVLSSLKNRSNDIIVICSFCKKVRTNESEWREIEEAIKLLNLQDVYPLPQLSHSVCETCFAAWEKENEA